MRTGATDNEDTGAVVNAFLMGEVVKADAVEASVDKSTEVCIGAATAGAVAGNTAPSAVNMTAPSGAVVGV